MSTKAAPFGWSRKDDLLSGRDLLDDRVLGVRYAPALDYMVLGVCLDPLEHKAISEIMADVDLEWTSETLGRLRLASGKLFLDGRAIGHVRRSRASMTRYGRKLMLHLTGVAWRTLEQDGARLNPSLVYPLHRAVWDRLAQAAGLDELHVRYTTIDRVDYAVELDVAPGVTPLAWLDLVLPAGYAWRTIVTTPGALKGIEDTGTTLYASRSKKALANRGDYPLLRVYQVDPGRIRVELEIPKIRTTTDSKSLGRRPAAELAAQLLSGCLPWDVPVVDHLQPGEVGVRVLDLDTVSALEVLQRRPFGGHPPKTLRRLTRQGVTLIQRAVGATLLASALATESLAAAPGSPAPELDGADLRVSYLEETDRGYTAAEVHDQAPLEEQDIDQVIALLTHYREVYIPRHKSLGGTPVEVPECAEHEGRAQGSKLYVSGKCDKSYRTCVGGAPIEARQPREAGYSWEWLPRYLEPERHEPLSSRSLAGFKIEQQEGQLVATSPAGPVLRVSAPRDWLSELGRGRAICDPGKAWQHYHREGRARGCQPLPSLCGWSELLPGVRQLVGLHIGYCEGSTMGLATVPE